MQPVHILLVDDERPFIEAVSRRLEQRGIIVDCAFSGSEALERLARDEAIEVVVLDIQMPGMDGIQTLGKIRQTYPLVETIMLTGHATIQTAVDAVSGGAFDFVEKPCEVDVLLAKARKAAARKRDREERLFQARTKPYISDRERREEIESIMAT